MKCEESTYIKNPMFESMIQVIDSTPCNAELLITPIEKHFASTLGNLLRRTIFHLTPGAAVTSITFQGIEKRRIHEFSFLPGVKENVMELVQNLKSAHISMPHYGPRFIFLKKRGPSRVTLGDIVTPSDIVILNPNQYVCTLSKKTDLDLKIAVESGIGFRPMINELSSLHPFQNRNEIRVHAVFSPITHICYHVKNFTFYEELVFHVQTDGSIPPLKVIDSAFSILSTKMSTFSLSGNDNLLKNV